MPTFLITGATGRQGGPTARLLLETGAKVHALVRDPTSPASLALEALGATLFKGDFDDVPAITAAMHSVDGVFFNPSTSLTDPNAELRAAETFVAAARAAGTVTSFVVSTFIRANYYPDWSEVKAEFPYLTGYFASKAAVENAIRASSGFTYTILRPGWLMHNYVRPPTAYSAFPKWTTERVLTSSYPPDFRMGHLDAADVGQFAAAALLDPRKFAGKEIDLVREWPTVEELAGHLSEATGVEIKVWEPSANLVDNSAELAEYGIRLTTFKEFLKKERGAIRRIVGIEG
ncbi:NAD dependent epimerase/dehydratase [Mycena filopes]|nr:NAD dependent epimerase/dehydratase [Mycena filopes]